METAVIYLRVSSEAQGEMYGLSAQLSACLEYVERQGYRLVGNRFVDAGTGNPASEGVPAYADLFTGAETMRPMLSALYQFLENEGADVVVVQHQDRLVRDDPIAVEVEIAERGGRVEYVLGISGNSPELEYTRGVLGLGARYERARTMARTMAGKREKARRGLFVMGRPPFGYKVDGNAPGGLAIDEAQAETVRLIFELYAYNRLSIREIARELSAKRRPNYNGRVQWHKASVAHILKNETYIGSNHYGKRRRVGRGGNKHVVPRARNEWLAIATVPIVDAELFAMAQARLAANVAEVRRRPKRFYLLGGMVRCDKCGRPFTSQTSPKGPRRKNDAQSYRHRARLGHCANRQISARKLEPVVWGVVEGLLRGDRALLREGYEGAYSEYGIQREQAREQIETSHRALMRLDALLGALLDAYIDPDIAMTKAVYQAKRRELESDAQRVRAELAQSQVRLAMVAVPPTLESLEHFADLVAERLSGEPSAEEKRELYEALELTVWIGEGDIIYLEGWFSSERLLVPTSAYDRPRATPKPYGSSF